MDNELDILYAPSRPIVRFSHLFDPTQVSEREAKEFDEYMEMTMRTLDTIARRLSLKSVKDGAAIALGFQIEQLDRANYSFQKSTAQFAKQGDAEAAEGLTHDIIDWVEITNVLWKLIGGVSSFDSLITEACSLPDYRDATVTLSFSHKGRTINEKHTYSKGTLIFVGKPPLHGCGNILVGAKAVNDFRNRVVTEVESFVNPDTEAANQIREVIKAQ